MLQLKPNFLTTEVLVIGAGGTGSRLVSKLAQFLVGNRMLPMHRITLIDDDVVEQKNLIRQLFIASDVGKHKAQVIAERYNKGFGANIVPVIGRLGKPDVNSQVEADVNYFAKVTDIPHLANATNIVIMICVDQVKARRDIIRGVMKDNKINRCLFFDAGNEATFGQVRVFTNSVGALITNYGSGNHCYLNDKLAGVEGIEYMVKAADQLAFDPVARAAGFTERYLEHTGKVDFGGEGQFTPVMPMALPGLTLTVDSAVPFPVSLYDLPIPLNHYATLQDSPGESCASLDQTLALNDLAAGIMFSLFQTYSYGLPLDAKVSYFTMTGRNSYEDLTFRSYLNDCIAWDVNLNLDALRIQVAHCLRTEGLRASQPNPSRVELYGNWVNVCTEFQRATHVAVANHLNKPEMYPDSVMSNLI